MTQVAAASVGAVGVFAPAGPLVALAAPRRLPRPDYAARFSLDGTDFEIDLSAKNARSFRARIAPFVEHGRQRSGEVRAWAREHGIAVRERGRIPVSVLEQYLAAARGR